MAGCSRAPGTTSLSWRAARTWPPFVQRGLEVRSAEFGTFVVHGAASDDAADLGQADLVLFAVKTYDLDQAALAAGTCSARRAAC